jgi:hypothetical protein
LAGHLSTVDFGCLEELVGRFCESRNRFQRIALWRSS